MKTRQSTVCRTAIWLSVDLVKMPPTHFWLFGSFTYLISRMYLTWNWLYTVSHTARSKNSNCILEPQSVPRHNIFHIEIKMRKQHHQNQNLFLTWTFCLSQGLSLALESRETGFFFVFISPVGHCRWCLTADKIKGSHLKKGKKSCVALVCDTVPEKTIDISFRFFQ